MINLIDKKVKIYQFIIVFLQYNVLTISFSKIIAQSLPIF